MISACGLRKQESPFAVLNRQLSEGKLKVGKEKEYSLTYCGQGSFVNTYKIKDNPNQILKAFHGNKTGFCKEELDQYLKNISHNYKRIQDAGLPIAKISNLDQLAEDQYILQDYVPNEIDLNSEEQLSQITPFFRASVEQKIVMDLHPDNFRADEMGNLRLVDFVEEVKPHKYTEDKVDMLNNRAIAGWFEKLHPLFDSKEKTIDRLQQLTGYSKEHIGELNDIKTVGIKIAVIGINKSRF